MNKDLDAVEIPSAPSFANAVAMPDVGHGAASSWRRTVHFGYLGGVFAEDGTPVPSALLTRTHDMTGFREMGSAVQIGRQAPLVSPQNRESGTFIYAGIPSAYFGHFIVESLARFWYVRQHPELPIVWTTGHGLTDWQQAILDTLGIRNPSLFINQPTEFEELIIPSTGHIFPTFFTPHFFQSLAVVEPSPVVAGRKLYISRSTSHSLGGMINESELESFLEENGWIIWRPEEQPFAERFAALSSAEVVLMIEGAVFLSYLLFTRVDTRIYALARNDDSLFENDVFFRDFFGIIGKEKPLPFQRLDLPKKWITREGTSARFELDLEAFRELMDQTHFLDRPDEAPPSCVTAYRHDRQRSIGDARRALDTLETHSTEDERHAYLAELNALKGDLGSAIRELEQALALAPDTAHYSARLGQLLGEKGDLERAAEALERAIAIGSRGNASIFSTEGYPPYHMELSGIYLKMGWFDQALSHASRAIEFLQENAGYLYHRANLFIATDNLEAAEKDLKHSAFLAPESADTHALLGGLYMRTENWPSALGAWDRVIEIDPGRAESHYYRGLVLQRTGDFNAARARYRDCLVLEPDHEDARLRLSEVLAALGNWKAAASEIESLIEMYPDSYRSHLHRASVLANLKRFAEARSALNTARSLNCPLWRLLRTRSKVEMRALFEARWRLRV